MIKPCPFCGSSASLESEHFQWWVQCDNLPDCSVTDGCIYDTPEEAETRWNRRPTESINLDAERYQFIVEAAIGAEMCSTEEFEVSFQPSGYNGGHFNWIEFGWRSKQWDKQKKEDIDAAIDAAKVEK